MDGSLLLLLLLLLIVIGTAVVFDFTNGVHATGKALATSIATRAVRPRIAVGLCALLNCAGAFPSIKVAATLSSGIVNAGVLPRERLPPQRLGTARRDGRALAVVANGAVIVVAAALVIGFIAVTPK